MRLPDCVFRALGTTRVLVAIDGAAAQVARALPDITNTQRDRVAALLLNNQGATP